MQDLEKKGWLKWWVYLQEPQQLKVILLICIFGLIYQIKAQQHRLETLEAKHNIEIEKANARADACYDSFNLHLQVTNKDQKDNEQKLYEILFETKKQQNEITTN